MKHTIAMNIEQIRFIDDWLQLSAKNIVGIDISVSYKTNNQYLQKYVHLS